MSELDDDILAMMGPLPELPELEFQEPDGILAMLGPLPELPDLEFQEVPGLWDGWAESVAQVEPNQLPVILGNSPRRPGKTSKKRRGNTPKSPPTPSGSLG
jgi:hypothetical protein